MVLTIYKRKIVVSIMNLLEKIIIFLQFRMTEPKIYEWFHIMCLIITILIIVFLWYKKYNSKKVLLVFSIIMLIFELYKQLSFSFTDNTWHYQWYIFPFQFCSVPMYVALIAALTKNKKSEKSLYSFLATYGLIAGIAVMLYPVTVFVEETLINIQTMVHHGFMVVMGSYLIINKDVELNFKTVLQGLKIFIVLVAIALITNIVTYYLGIDNGLELFYISPFHTSILPVFSIIYDKVPYIVFLLLYIVSFSIGSYIPLLIFQMIDNLKGKYNCKRGEL